MKSLMKFLKWTLVVLIILVLGFYIFVQMTWNKSYSAPYPDIRASTDSAVIARGAYLANSASHCGGCHAPIDDIRQFDAGKRIDFKGGMELKYPGFGTFYTPNLTSDKETGTMANWSEDEFIRRFRQGREHKNSPMPWGSFSRMDTTEFEVCCHSLL